MCTMTSQIAYTDTYLKKKEQFQNYTEEKVRYDATNKLTEWLVDT